MTPRRTARGSESDEPRRVAQLSLGALGIVFGDIGTSPLYALRESFESAGNEVVVNEQNVLGILSLILWSLITVIAVKYLALVMRADNDGEGGILALTALVMPRGPSTRRRWTLVLIGLFGTALLYGDGMITPAISVLSAVEGTEVATSRVDPYVIPIAVAILVGLFSVQRRGTGSVGRIFGPVIVLWFVVLATLGTIEIARVPEVLDAVSPVHAVRFFAENGVAGFLALGSVFLVVTGGEALFADMGHFGRLPIAIGWYALVLPGLVLNYFGQGALLMSEPDAIDNPFYRLAPHWALLPLVVLATGATVIASQALISGAFSLTHQAAQLGYVPRVQIEHTSATERGQVYVPSVNWALMVACVGMVVGFRSSTNLAAAYGVAVTMTMAITTVIFFVVVRERFEWSGAQALVVCGAFFAVDLGFFGANIPKIPHGGWFPLLAAVVVFTLLTTWRAGRSLTTRRLRQGHDSLESFVAELEDNPRIRVPGTAVYMFSLQGLTPPALRASFELQHSVHERVIVLTVETADVPTVQPVFRLNMEQLGQGVEQARVRFGFMDRPDVPAELAFEVPEIDEVTYVLGTEEIAVDGADEQGIAPWRERLFGVMHRNAISPSSYFNLPVDRTVTVAKHIAL